VTDTEQVVDVAALMDRLEGDRELLQELVALYLEDEPGLLDQIARAVDSKDADALRRSAHTLKGSVGNFCAPGAHAAALALEDAGRSGELKAASVLFDRLRQELVSVRVALTGLVA
jgi:HPt (histidine-containing phosphotransfer) domain-containing protein